VIRRDNFEQVKSSQTRILMPATTLHERLRSKNKIGHIQPPITSGKFNEQKE